ncbi:hypothetical protein NDU88_003607 [Pleurodeles waltl]|uniref:Uncharacterized protein n=1 Tax=Pleurodeles waltl TaxID=8319 RepID=A0AAV7W5J3_PLEWA|nr:hypothetical protein NDU88_003607 [Pleurodeles waltl]
MRHAEVPYGSVNIDTRGDRDRWCCRHWRRCKRNMRQTGGCEGPTQYRRPGSKGPALEHQGRLLLIDPIGSRHGRVKGPDIGKLLVFVSNHLVDESTK